MENSEASTQPRQIDLLLARYEESHRHPMNEKIHWICVPVIVWTVFALIWVVHPILAGVSAILALTYYFSLSLAFAFGMSLMMSAMLLVTIAIPDPWLLPVAVAVFVLAWIGQFIGHKIEGKKPSFFDDLRYLLIGPLFVLRFLYRRLKIAY